MTTSEHRSLYTRYSTVLITSGCLWRIDPTSLACPGRTSNIFVAACGGRILCVVLKDVGAIRDFENLERNGEKGAPEGEVGE